MKSLLILTLSIIAMNGFSSFTFNGDYQVHEKTNTVLKANNDNVITIYNSSDYIDESLITAFEEEYNCTVNYYTFDTNETMYNQFTLQPEGTYDLLCPSEYMIQKLVSEDLIIPLDRSKLTTYNEYAAQNIKDKLDEMLTTAQKKDGSYYTLGDYAAGYMWGTMGIVYDPEYVDEEDVKTWDIFWNEKYHKMASVKNSMRDTYVVGILHAYQDELNVYRQKYENGEISALEYNAKIQEVFDRHSQEDINKVREELISMKNNIYGFEVDSGKNDIITGKIKMNLAWSGDAVYSIDTASEEADKYLEYSVPEEGSNIWYDGWVMPKGANEELAYAFINFLSDPTNAAINMNYIGYTSFVASEEVFDQVVNWYGAHEYYEGTPYSAELEDVVHYGDKFYLCIQDAQGILPTDEEYFEELPEEDWPLTTPVDLSYYFASNLPEGKAALCYPYEDTANQLEAQYPTVEIINRCAFMNDFGKDNANVVIMWSQVKAATNMVPYYVIIILAIALVPCYFLIKIIKEKREQKYLSDFN